MGQPVARMGDHSSHGGIIISGNSSVLVNGKASACSGDLHQCPIKDHGITPITGSGKALINGIARVRVGDVAGCGAVITEGSPTVECA